MPIFSVWWVLMWHFKVLLLENDFWHWSQLDPSFLWNLWRCAFILMLVGKFLLHCSHVEGPLCFRKCFLNSLLLLKSAGPNPHISQRSLNAISSNWLSYMNNLIITDYITIWSRTLKTFTLFCTSNQKLNPYYCNFYF